MERDDRTGGSGRFRNERGSTIVIAALAMVALFSAVALAIDIGMLLTARTEAQRVADASAMAGALELIDSPGNDAAARAAAQVIGEDPNNVVVGEVTDIEDGDVDVDLANGIVTVTVNRLADRGNPVSTWFARVFGVTDADIVASAAAQVQPASSTNCAKPWTIMDAFFNVAGTIAYEPGLGDIYHDSTRYGTAYGSDWRNANQDNPTGYESEVRNYVEDVGRPIRIKAGNPSKDDPTVPGWFFPWDIECPGGDCYRDAIAECKAGVDISTAEDPIYYKNETGVMIGPTKQGVKTLMDKDPVDASWDTSTHQPVGCGTGFEDTHCDRVIHIPLYDPNYVIESGKKDLYFVNMMCLWLDGIDGNGIVTGRFMKCNGGFGGNNNAAGIQGVRLIQ